jgi:zinc protease
MGLTAEFLREDFATGLDLLTDVLLNPALRPEALDRERAAQLAAIRGQRDKLLNCAFNGMRRGLFGPQGYGLDVVGTEASVKALTSGALGAFHRRWVTPANAVLAVYGDIQAEAAIEAIEASLGSWSGAAVTPDLTGGTSLHQARHLETRDKEQAVIALGFPGTTFDNPDRYALELLQEACSDMGSRLFMRIRDTLGLAYYVGASHFIGRRPGYFAFYCGTAPQHCEQVEAELRSQAEQLRTGGLTPEELTRAKAKVVGQRKIARQDLGHQAMTAALDELYGLGYQHGDTDDARFERVTLEDVAAVAGRYLVADRSVVSIVRGQDAGAA